jgi:hypothetical protein
MIKWIFGLVLMGLYQYWVYSSFWISTDDVTQVKRAQHITGEILSIECVEGKGKYVGRQDFYIQFVGKRNILDFTDEGSVSSCEELYSKLDKALQAKDGNERFHDKLMTKVNGKYYPLARLESYFRGAVPLKVNINDFKWFTFSKAKQNRIGFVMWLSLTPIFTVMALIFGFWMKQGKVQAFIEKLGSNH